MAKGYWIAHVDVRHQDGYKDYVAMLPDIMRKYGGRYVMRGGKADVVEGKSRSYCLPEYAKAVALRKANADADLIVIEGYDGPQP